jgi:hypothetical protein
MTSKKQIQANKQNAKLGGVKTENGKEISKYNAMKHGILSKEVLLHEEDKESFIDFGAHIYAHLQPENELEAIFVDRIISGMWRLKRTLSIETASMEWTKFEKMKELCIYAENDEHKKMRAMRETITHDSIEKIQRYETSIERGLFKALHEFQRLQMIRKGGNFPMPASLDIDISSD